MSWATGVLWAMGANRGPAALATAGGPTALASPPVAQGITSLVPRGGEVPPWELWGFLKPPGRCSEPARALKQGPRHEHMEHELWGPAARMSLPGTGRGGGCVCPAANYPVPQRALAAQLSRGIPCIPLSPRLSPGSRKGHWCQSVIPASHSSPCITFSFCNWLVCFSFTLKPGGVAQEPLWFSFVL